ncbi:MAG: SDR family NAD(P)-dependent oxidoreductase [Acidobacteria bacterium]|nr:SDR family NAD(P)-dependent oxidoreductase [Acidobacteriota bacterium]
MDLSGKVFAVTGSSSGLGEESARGLASRGAHVAMAARDAGSNAEAAQRIRAAVPGADLSLHQLDLADLSSVARFAEQVVGVLDHVDVLINNAGVMACPEGRTADGFETQFGTNHLGHFALTVRLMPLLRRAQNPRVVTLSSGGHRISDVDLDDPNFDTTPYDAWVAYGRSKSANAHFAAELARRSGGSMVSFSVHPGAIVTRLGRHLTPELTEALMARARASASRQGGSSGGGMRFKSVEAGAATQVWAAISPDAAAHNGGYLADCGPTAPGPGEQGYEPWIADASTAGRLWELSERLVGLALADS